MKRKYDDIISLPRHVSKLHPQMSTADRAIQFAPFAALTGLNHKLGETARITDTKVELTEEACLALGRKLSQAAGGEKAECMVDITYFVPDAFKEGGEYVTVSGSIKKIDNYTGYVIMNDGLKIPMDDICSVDGDMLNE